MPGHHRAFLEEAISSPNARAQPDGVASATPDVGSVKGFFFPVVRPHEVLENLARDSFAALFRAHGA